MSSLDQDIDMNENQEPQIPQIKDNTSETPTSASTGGVVRTNSVRARANMFQQLQEKTNSGAGLNREERTSPKRGKSEDNKNKTFFQVIYLKTIKKVSKKSKIIPKYETKIETGVTL